MAWSGGSNRFIEQFGSPSPGPRTAESNPRRNLLVAALVALVTMVLLGPAMTNGELTLSGEGSAVRQIAYLAIAGLLVYAVLPVASRASIIALPATVLAALAWCWLSTLWAVNVEASIRRVFLTTLVVWMAFCAVRHAGYRLTADVVRACLAAAVLVSYLLVVLDPTVGVHLMRDAEMATALGGNWRGFLDHKNFAGAVCAICVLMFVFDARHIRPALRVAVIAGAGYFLFRTQSKTAGGMVILAALGGVIFSTVSTRLRAYLIPIICVSGAVGGALASAYKDLLTRSFSDPASFTGRGQLWAILLDYSRDNPMTGAGFGSFWNVGAVSPVFSYAQGWPTRVTIGHSGYLDQLAAVGLPGLLLMVFALIVWPLWRLLSSKSVSREQGAMISALLIFCMGHNVTESGLFERDVIVSFFLYLAAAFAHYCTLGERHLLSRWGTRTTDGAGSELLRAMRRRQRAVARVQDL